MRRFAILYMMRFVMVALIHLMVQLLLKKDTEHHQPQLADRKPDRSAPVFQGNNAVMFHDR